MIERLYLLIQHFGNETVRDDICIGRRVARENGSSRRLYVLECSRTYFHRCRIAERALVLEDDKHRWTLWQYYGTNLSIRVEQ